MLTPPYPDFTGQDGLSRMILLMWSVNTKVTTRWIVLDDSHDVECEHGTQRIVLDDSCDVEFHSSISRLGPITGQDGLSWIIVLMWSVNTKVTTGWIVLDDSHDVKYEHRGHNQMDCLGRFS
jgi:hypothetical protein